MQGGYSMSNHSVLIAFATVATLIFCAVGILFRKRDIFSALNHPLAKKYPNISKNFGTVMICFSLTWFLLAIIHFVSQIS